MKKGNRNIIYISIAVLAILLISSYFFFLYTPSCSSSSCFLSSLKSCSRASYINEDDTGVWQYNIGLSFGSTCNVGVKALAIKTDVESSTALTGKQMTCYIPRGTAVDFPEKNLSYCHGDLKESIQDLMLKRTQLYVINALK